ncbi:MAG: hypothetical protein M3397_00635 [Actinomycetota bacterium]|nr:hypothetical protein [Actinomycetota bacterium]MDQ3566571.1 hypothetical protein [Actinomycetota bacterium]
MGYAERATVRRVREAKGIEARIVELEKTARGAREAADSLGCAAGATMTVRPHRYGHRSSCDRGGLHETRGG